MPFNAILGIKSDMHCSCCGHKLIEGGIRFRPAPGIINAVKINEVVSDIAEKHGVTEQDLLGRSRAKNLILPRHLVMYLFRKKLNLSFPQIAKIMKRADHSTVIHAVNKIDKLIKENKLARPGLRF